MDGAQHLAQELRKALRTSEKPAESRPEHNSLQTRIAFELLSKALDTTKLVRVERPVTVNGKTHMTHKWIKPDKVRKGDVVIGGKGVWEKFKKEHEEKKAAAAKEAGPKEEKKKPAGGVNPMQKLAALQKRRQGRQASRRRRRRRKSRRQKPRRPPRKRLRPGKRWQPRSRPSRKRKPKRKWPSPDRRRSRRKLRPKRRPSSHPVLQIRRSWSGSTRRPDSTCTTSQLGDQASAQQAADALADLYKDDWSISAQKFRKGVEAIVVQHASVLYGRDKLAKMAAPYQGTYAAKHYSPEFIAAAVSSWTGTKSGPIREQSENRFPAAIPSNTSLAGA